MATPDQPLPSASPDDAKTTPRAAPREEAATDAAERTANAPPPRQPHAWQLWLTCAVAIVGGLGALLAWQYWVAARVGSRSAAFTAINLAWLSLVPAWFLTLWLGAVWAHRREGWQAWLRALPIAGVVVLLSAVGVLAGVIPGLWLLLIWAAAPADTAGRRSALADALLQYNARLAQLRLRLRVSVVALGWWGMQIGGLAWLQHHYWRPAAKWNPVQLQRVQTLLTLHLVQLALLVLAGSLLLGRIGAQMRHRSRDPELI